jgi:hypothetical protein
VPVSDTQGKPGAARPMLLGKFLSKRTFFFVYQEIGATLAVKRDVPVLVASNVAESHASKQGMQQGWVWCSELSKFKALHSQRISMYFIHFRTSPTQTAQAKPKKWLPCATRAY